MIEEALLEKTDTLRVQIERLVRACKTAGTSATLAEIIANEYIRRATVFEPAAKAMVEAVIGSDMLKQIFPEKEKQ